MLFVSTQRSGLLSQFFTGLLVFCYKQMTVLSPWKLSPHHLFQLFKL